VLHVFLLLHVEFAVALIAKHQALLSVCYPSPRRGGGAVNLYLARPSTWEPILAGQLLVVSCALRLHVHTSLRRRCVCFANGCALLVVLRGNMHSRLCFSALEICRSM
jgi:hypothetical protein